MMYLTHLFSNKMDDASQQITFYFQQNLKKEQK